MSKSCGIEFPHFGASYPDARCCNGYLWDMDSWDESLGGFTIGGNEPCPVCNTEKWLDSVVDEDGEFETREKALAYVEQLKKRYLNVKLISKIIEVMHKICTSIEQSDKLIELGIDRKTSDMYYWCGEDLRIGGYRAQDEEYDIPAWSLAALLDVLPYPQLSKDKLGGDKEGWMVSVYPNDCRYDSCWHDNPIDACVEMIITLHGLKLL